MSISSAALAAVGSSITSGLRAAVAACAIAAGLAAAPAQAAIQLRSYDVATVVNYEDTSVDIFRGAFTLSVDTASDAVSLQDIDLLGFYRDFNTGNSSAYRDGAQVVVRGYADFSDGNDRGFELRFAPEPLAFVGFSTSYNACAGTLSCLGNMGSTDEGLIRLTAVSTAAPEPATWALMMLGFGAAGAVLRRSRQPTAAA